MRKYTHLSSKERVLISHYHDNGISVSEIGRLIGRPKSTVSRELSRNSNQRSYTPQTAKKRYLVRRQKPSKIDQHTILKTYIVNALHEGISPEMIAMRLNLFGHLEKVPSISHESIYRWIYRPPQKKEKLYNLLVQHHSCRGRRKRVHRGKIKDRVSIHERPESVLNRKEIGHWEADLMSFRGNKQHLLVLHERKTRYTAAVRLNTKTAIETIKAMLGFFETLPKELLKSVTFDNGTEFTRHREITDTLGVPTYFCDVYASWQKGGIENMNGRFRRDLPRKTDILNMREEELEQIIISHNMAPRKILKGISPMEALAKHQGRNIIFLFNTGVALHM